MEQSYSSKDRMKFTIASDEAELVDESFAWLTTICIYILRSDTAHKLFMDEGM